MSSDPSNTNNRPSHEDGFNINNPHLAPSRRSGGRRRGGVGIELPDAQDVQTNNPSESQPGGAIFRAMLMFGHEPALLKEQRAPVYKSAPAADSSNRKNLADDSRQPFSRADLKRELPPLPAPTLSNTSYLQWNKASVEVQQLPMYFPKNNLNHKFPQRCLGAVLDCLSELLRHLSIQAKLRDSPLSAFLQTTENVEFYLVFFHEKPTPRNPSSTDPDNCMIYMSVQRHKGDQMTANRYFHAIVEAAKEATGAGAGESVKRSFRSLPTHRNTPNAEELLQVERLVVRSSERSEDPATKGIDAHGYTKQTPKDMIQSSVAQLYSWIQTPRRLDNRQHVLEYLAVMTDVKRTMSSSAIAGALLVLQGCAPDMNDEAKEIQRFFLTILQYRALPGDRAMFEGMSTTLSNTDEDIEMRPYFPEEADEVQGFPSFFVEYMNKLFHLALQVLVQSLEVVACFHKQIVDDGCNILDMASDFLFCASELACGKELYTTLLECVNRAESKLSNAYLACKAFRLLALACPTLKDRLKCDDAARTSIENAYNIGKSCHSLLKDESFQLWETVRQ
ncbi:hypothetical protein IV203_021256 [Nitzschia inconspicua]|uniref:Uncharacterized protein n=1 Tax=Nitzschia inconspicua TaxID=303405 RepID=A0A9K3KH89_9STRA|nr:hypothetical protein IV203_021256 [Nitzschia inconspicua]